MDTAELVYKSMKKHNILTTKINKSSSIYALESHGFKTQSRISEYARILHRSLNVEDDLYFVYSIHNTRSTGVNHNESNALEQNL